jgi:hypothetical protein
MEKLLFCEICAIMLPTRKFGFGKRNLIGVKLGERGFQNHLTAVAKAAA